MTIYWQRTCFCLARQYNSSFSASTITNAGCFGTYAEGPPQHKRQFWQACRFGRTSAAYPLLFSPLAVIWATPRMLCLSVSLAACCGSRDKAAVSQDWPTALVAYNTAINRCQWLVQTITAWAPAKLKACCTLCWHGNSAHLLCLRYDVVDVRCTLKAFTQAMHKICSMPEVYCTAHRRYRQPWTWEAPPPPPQPGSE